MTNKRRRTEWAKKIEEQHQSGLGIAQWCREKGISSKTFYHWKRILTKEESKNPETALPTGWCQIQAKPAVESPAGLKLVINNQITIELQPGFDRQLLRDALTVLCR